ncbi:MAG: thermosome subunit, partial [Thermoplasmatales archaeon]|nr:thermosome subunit [Thermoplasmatales archaeon]
MTSWKEMEIQHPAGKMLAEVAKAQDQECGDGTKTSVILTGELLKNAEELLDEKIHPTVITQGYQIASEKALEFLDELARPVRITDQDLLHTVAMTSMYSKGVAGHAAFLSTLAVRAVTEVAEDREGRYLFDKKNIQVLKRSGGDLSDSEVIEGHIVDQPA